MLSPFIFIIGLAGLVRKASGVGDFKGFNVQNRFKVKILQFAYDTLLIGDGRWKNLWSIKVVLRGFEIVSGLGFNLHKS